MGELAPIDIYRFRDADGVLLYVGISLHAAVRAMEHRAGKSWWGQVVTLDVTHLGLISRSDAEAIERDAIIAEQPLYNIVHNRHHRLPTARRVRSGGWPKMGNLDAPPYWWPKGQPWSYELENVHYGYAPDRKVSRGLIIEYMLARLHPPDEDTPAARRVRAAYATIAVPKPSL